MSPGKLTARSSLQISFKTARFLFRSECDCCFDLSLPFLHRVRALSAIVFGQSRSEVARYAGVMHFVIRGANEYVDVVEVVDQSHCRCIPIMAEEGWPAKP